ncbi:MAG: citramalate synthase [Pelagibacteraceae bacterium]|jgi:2-isopropylmalate synthase|nr:citramalate synthase [Pelagibacteraceae bacterium]MBT3901307.1 citramalate synthase [Pelagibacteraceae bacterium]MBT4950211.1 citramalate synthase [Pelagibacteraceae bacterium]MBT5214056.1 citramalate synthase [Pelagibacteraceae bacterium]MBT6198759.1 citramalate synthase [Pelagibacteraceae bacterium]
MNDQNKIYLFDTTLRDGQQTTGVNFSVSDKMIIAKNLDELGIDYIEGGWPGANPTDNDFFSRDLNFSTSKFTAFGMTRRPGRSADNDPGLNALVNSNANTICLVGKSSSYQVKSALGITEEENLLMLSDSFNYLKNKNKESIYDAEHFFDGFKNNKEYAIECLNASYNSGVRWIVLCDTNGGTLPNEISEIIDEVKKVIPSEKLGIHAHNDTENGVANALAAINTGVRHVQGTINGLGERCGNTNLISLIPSLVLKTNFNTNISKDKLKSLTKISNTLSDILNEPKPKNSPYVGENAFSHKGGLHASAVAKDPSTYEHINPDLVGNTRNVIISDQAGKANLLSQLDKLSIKIDNNELSQILELIKQKESEGFSYDVALASFELLVRRHIGQINEYFSLNKFRVTDERRWNAKGKLVTDSEATVHLEVKNEEKMTVGVGNGPVNAIDSALRQALINFYPTLNDLKLTDYKVMILSSDKGTGAITRVHIESTDDSKRHWTTVGVSSNIIDASYNAIYDSITYKLFNDLNN